MPGRQGQARIETQMKFNPNVTGKELHPLKMAQADKDLAHSKLLIEGHIFSELPFAGNITTIYLDAAAHSEIHDNARKFATKHGAKLVVDKI